MPRPPNSSPETTRLLEALLSAPEQWHYGYDLSKQTGLKSGTLYPLLMRLEQTGWLEAEWEERGVRGRPARHIYRLTEAGRAEATRRAGTAAPELRLKLARSTGAG
jgi:DNA-binding PadR family transcriptional regulator